MAFVLGVACGARYKTRPGLSYHLSHSHSKPSLADDELNLLFPSPRPSSAAAADGQRISVSMSMSCARRFRRCDRG